MKNVISIDVEDYFQVEAFASSIAYDQWETYELRVERNVYRVLDLLATHGVIGTFFVLGWIAKRCPLLIREIAAAGHEIGSHGYAHRRLLQLTPGEFREDLRRSVAILADQVQQPIGCYRAPSFSVVASTFWALDILAEEGIVIDSSIFPIRHDLYGVPEAERFPHWLTTAGGHRLFEFPPSTVRLCRNNLAVGGGGYLRLTPYWLTINALRYINEVERKPAMIYFHPWELDPGQPRIPSGLRSRVRHYTNLSTMYGKLERLLGELSVGTLSQVCQEFEAYNLPPAFAGSGICQDGTHGSG